ncbi:MAG: copper homeostasis protein CutC [Chitinophagaceae bacterium]|nr:copper homeostasis protein CutC [Chitinophagaceae bacterium]
MCQKYILEIAAFSLPGAMQAEKAGAQRIELCDNAADGGTTPSYGSLVMARQKIHIPVFPIIRPRGGNFVYSKTEFECIKEDILQCRKLNYPGIVVGFLDSKGHVDTKKLKAAVRLAGPMQVTFHRAFDRTRKPLKALEEIIECGCTRILTSGQFPSVQDGIDHVRILTEKAQGRIIIMPGSGLNSSNIAEIAQNTNAVEFHTAARKSHHNKAVFSPKTMHEKLSYTSVDQKEIKKILKVLANI